MAKRRQTHPMNSNFPYSDRTFKQLLSAAVSDYWHRRIGQAESQAQRGIHDAGTRGEVTGGRQLDAFADILSDLAKHAGYRDNEVFTHTPLPLPGYYRPQKTWDLAIFRNGRIIAAIELKSQSGSFGNNFNNRAEEVIGLARDFQTAYREKAFGLSPYPWLGYFFLLEDTEPSRKTVKLAPSPLPPMRKFNNTSYQDRYRLLCEALILERDFSATSLLLARKPSETAGALYSEPRPDLSFSTFCKSFFTHILAQSNA